MKLTRPEILRYARHFPVIGVEGQEKLKQAKVLCIGTGGLGAPALQYLSAAGVGTLGLVDNDQVSLSNLHRQILFAEDDVGKSKVICTRDRLLAQNPHIQVHAYEEWFTADTAENLVTQYDILLDGSDNYKTRYLINDYSFLNKKPLVSASIFQFQGQVSVFNYQEGPCYRCLYAEPPPPELSPSCDIGGVLGVLPGIIGTIQAAEVIKLITGKGQTLSNRLLQFNALNMKFKEYAVKKDPNCPLCHHGQLSRELFEKNAHYNAQLVPEIEPEILSAWLHDPTKQLKLIDVREPYERSICNIGGDLMPATDFNIAEFAVDRKTPIVVYCKAGARSHKIAKIIKAAGYEEVYVLKGGMVAWIETIDPTLIMY